MNLLQGLDFSISIPVTDRNITTLIYAYYGLISTNINPELTMNVITTKLDANKDQLMDLNNVTNITQSSPANLVIPLDAGKLLKMTDVNGTIVNIQRGALTDGSSTNQTNQINVNNTGWINYGQIVRLFKYSFKFAGSGSPIIINASTNPIIAPPSQPQLPPSAPPSPPADNTMMYVGIGVVVIFIIIGAGAYVLMNKGNSPESPTGKKGGHFEDGE
jgi:hypothetical protein